MLMHLKRYLNVHFIKYILMFEKRDISTLLLKGDYAKAISPVFSMAFKDESNFWIQKLKFCIIQEAGGIEVIAMEKLKYEIWQGNLLSHKHFKCLVPNFESRSYNSALWIVEVVLKVIAVAKSAISILLLDLAHRIMANSYHDGKKFATFCDFTDP